MEIMSAQNLTLKHVKSVLDYIVSTLY